MSIFESQLEKNIRNILIKLENKDLVQCPLCYGTGVQIDKQGIRHFCVECNGWGLIIMPSPSFDINKLEEFINLN